MSLCFVTRQVEHANSILILVPHRDCILIARCMTEGLIQLFWAAKAPRERALQWRSYVWVSELLSRAAAAAGRRRTPEQLEHIDKGLKTYGHQFLTKRGRASVPTAVAGSNEVCNQLTDERYYKNWRCGKTLSAMSDEAGAEQIYNELYVPLSDWEHWGPEGLGHGLQRSAETFRYVASSYSVAAQALAAAFQCLLQSIGLLYNHIALGISARLSSMRDAYVNSHSSRPVADDQAG